MSIDPKSDSSPQSDHSSSNDNSPSSDNIQNTSSQQNEQSNDAVFDIEDMMTLQFSAYEGEERVNL
jgi:hypothetical protein